MGKVAVVIVAFLCAAQQPAVAAHDANMVGQLEGFYVYSYSDRVYFRLKNQQKTHNGCNPQYFVIPATVGSSRI